jgi:hypothetical protein
LKRAILYRRVTRALNSAEARAVVATDANMKLLNKDFVQYLQGCLHA